MHASANRSSSVDIPLKMCNLHYSSCNFARKRLRLRSIFLIAPTSTHAIEAN